MCDATEFEDYYNVSSDLTKYDVKEVVVDESCGCIVSGYLKYLRDGKTVALVVYGYGECVNWALKTLCVDCALSPELEESE